MKIDKLSVGLGILGLLITGYVIYSEISRISGTNSEEEDKND
jgi:hypothetical protein